MMSKAFEDHFQRVAPHYLKHRPSYPAALFDWLAQCCSQHQLAWDCGTGNGQAAVSLAQHFQHVLATDASAAQIAAATAHGRVEYRLAAAQASGLAPASVDLLVVAQALHWFDLERFYAEARRVLKPGGIIAVWCYGTVELEGEAANLLLQHFYHQVVGPYWPAEREHVATGYRQLPFPFSPIDAPPFPMHARWTREQLLGYLRSWSATGHYQAAQGADPVLAFEQTLSTAWPDAKQPRQVRWPLSVRVGRASGG